MCVCPPTDEGGDPELRRDARGAVHYVASWFAWEQSARGHSLGRRAEIDSRGRRSSLGCYRCWPGDRKLLIGVDPSRITGSRKLLRARSPVLRHDERCWIGCDKGRHHSQGAAREHCERMRFRARLKSMETCLELFRPGFPARPRLGCRFHAAVHTFHQLGQ